MARAYMYIIALLESRHGGAGARRTKGEKELKRLRDRGGRNFLRYYMRAPRGRKSFRKNAPERVSRGVLQRASVGRGPMRKPFTRARAIRAPLGALTGELRARCYATLMPTSFFFFARSARIMRLASSAAPNILRAESSPGLRYDMRHFRNAELGGSRFGMIKSGVTRVIRPTTGSARGKSARFRPGWRATKSVIWSARAIFLRIFANRAGNVNSRGANWSCSCPGGLQKIVGWHDFSALFGDCGRSLWSIYTKEVLANFTIPWRECMKFNCWLLANC